MCYNIAYLEARAEKYANRYKDIPQITWQQRLEFEKGLPTYYFVSGFVHPLAGCSFKCVGLCGVSYNHNYNLSSA